MTAGPPPDGASAAARDADAADAADAAVEALLVTVDTEARRSFWRRFGEALKKVAIATGQGTAWAARAGYDNRHYLPAVINGAVGDALARRGDRLAIAMAFRDERGDVAVEALAAPLAAGGGHVAVFLHGLMADDVYWREPFGDGEGLGPRLARTAGVTPLYVRYNSGLHVSQNGRALAGLLAELVAQHGPAIRTLSLIGHSMGGLVARSAGYYGTALAQPWIDRAGAVVLLGAPNDGSYLEQLSHLTAFVLDAIPNLPTRLIARVIDGRSDGIKDLRLGALVDEDWRAARHGDLAVVPLLPHVSYHVIAGTLIGELDSLIATYLGDGLVGTRSALGEHVRCRVFPGVGHLALVAHPEVQQHVHDALVTVGALAAGPGSADDVR